MESNRENKFHYLQFNSFNEKNKFSTNRNENSYYYCNTLEPCQGKEEESLFMSFKKEK